MTEFETDDLGLKRDKGAVRREGGRGEREGARRPRVEWRKGGVPEIPAVYMYIL